MTPGLALLLLCESASFPSTIDGQVFIVRFGDQT